MDRLRRALSLSQNSSSSNKKDSKKNKEIMISEKNEKSLQDWKLPPCSASDVFKPSNSFTFSSDCRVKTVEKEIPISEDYASVPLFTDNLQRVYQNIDSELDLHVGIIQVALKPTKLGSNTSAIICLRDKRFLKFHDSILGMVESSLCDGPIYFSYFPTHHVSFGDPDLSSAFTIDIKTQGSSSDENIILMYIFHYKVLSSRDPNPKKLLRILVDVDGIGETTLFLTNVSRSNTVVSKKIHWDQISVPERWMVRNKPPSAAGEEGAVANARVDWKETAEAHVLKVDVPGFKKEEVKIEVEDGRILQISGERSKEQEETNDKWHCEERSSGKFLRRFGLPENAKLEQVKAAVENGVLTVTVPKKDVNEKPEVKVIDVSS